MLINEINTQIDLYKTNIIASCVTEDNNRLSLSGLKIVILWIDYDHSKILELYDN